MTPTLVNLLTGGAATVTAAATCWFALTRGGRTERIAALVYGFEWFASIPVSWLLFHGREPPWPLGWLWDFAMAAVFLYLAIRDRNRWMAAAAIAQGVQMGLVAVRVLTGEYGTSFAHALWIVVYSMTYAMQASIAASTWGRVRRISRPVPA